MKRFLALMLALVLLILIVPTDAVTVHVHAKTTKTTAEALDWLDSLVGKKVGSGQCVALIKAYYEHLGAPTPYGNGCDYATNALPSGWKRIKGGTPQPGDILVWTEGYENYGHVAICGGSSKYYHQNWDGYYVQVLKKSYTGGFSISSGKYHANYYGVIRPDFTASSNPSVSYEGIASGKYFIRNKASGEYLTVADGKDADLTKIYTKAFGNYDYQVYNIYQEKDGYEMMPLCSTTRVVNPYCSTVTAGKPVNLYEKSDDGTQWWKFQIVNNGLVIRNAQNPNVCLANTSADSITIETYTGSDDQIWFLEAAFVITYDANGGSDAAEPQRVREGYETVLSTQKPIQQCSKFMGWSLERDDGIADWDETDTAAFFEDTTVYAVWSEDHSYTTVVTAPTCTQSGAQVYTCSDCGDVYTESIPAVGHQYEHGVCITCGAESAGGNGGDNATAALSGTITGCGDSADPVTVCIYAKSADTALHTLSTQNGSFTVKDLPAGEYRITFSKKDHVTREYTVTLETGEMILDAEICLLGDVTGDGKTNIMDVVMLYAYVKGGSLADDYALRCADVTEDNKVNIMDVVRLYAHVKGVSPLY